MADPRNFRDLADGIVAKQTLGSRELLIPFALALTSLVETEGCPAPADVEHRVAPFCICRRKSR
ncbi:MAG: hypothetical protein K0R38_5131 [Polyangiaceae bacterium]|nr:hypothetical protein [Polyangiaceae bacterium]